MAAVVAVVADVVMAGFVVVVDVVVVVDDAWEDGGVQLAAFGFGWRLLCELSERNEKQVKTNEKRKGKEGEE